MTKRKSPGEIATPAIIDQLHALVLARGEHEIGKQLGINRFTAVRILARLPVMKGTLLQVQAGLTAMQESPPVEGQ